MKFSITMILTFAAIGCQNPEPSSKSSTLPAQATVSATVDKFVDKVPHPQSPVLKDGRLEDFNYFLGKSINGKILPDGEQSPPSKGTLVGKRLGVETKIDFKLVLERDPCARDENGNIVGDLPLYRVADGKNKNLCAGSTLTVLYSAELDRCANKGTTELQPKLDNFNQLHNLAVAIPGEWDDKGIHHKTDTLTLACVSGILAKCAHWGYVPWAEKYANQPDLWDYYESCVSAAMATYETNGDSYTCGGTAIEIFDSLGIQRKTTPLPKDHGTDMTLESLWSHSTEDLLCMRHARFAGCERKFNGDAGTPRFAKYDPDCSEAKYPTWKIGVASIANTIPDDDQASPSKCPHSKPNPIVCSDL